MNLSLLDHGLLASSFTAALGLVRIAERAIIRHLKSKAPKNGAEKIVYVQLAPETLSVLNDTHRVVLRSEDRLVELQARSY